MTRYAVQGEPHDRVPAELVAATSTRREVVPWLCPDCDGTVAETVVDHVGSDLTTNQTVLPFEWVHHADREGVPFYGPTNREWRGKSPGRRAGPSAESQARSREVRRRKAFLRTMRDAGSVQADLASAISVPLVFDTVCRPCRLVLRIDLPPR